jgi:hypothetical protein
MYINKTEAEVLLELIISMNNGKCGHYTNVVRMAREQLENMKDLGVRFNP